MDKQKGKRGKQYGGKKCPNCGAEIPEDREYCEQCEEQLKQTAGTSKREEMNQNSDLAETVVSQDEAIDEVAVQAEMEQEVTDNKETLLNQGKKKINRAIVISAISWQEHQMILKVKKLSLLEKLCRL